jgi:serine/threonine protein kinase/DNA-binding beta-propeller fold protein YncE
MVSPLSLIDCHRALFRSAIIDAGERSVPESKARSDGPGDGGRAKKERLVAGRYRLVRELGRGGMGVVWLAEDQLVGRRVAVKELRPPDGLARADRAVHNRRALQEARSAARIDHPNAVTLYDVLPASAADDAVYLIMELIRGPTLARLIERDGALPARRVARYGLQLLDVLAAAHALGIVHRDVKPGNIMITAAGRLKLADFGIAHTMGDPRLTRGGGVMGTRAYMAPELFDQAPISPAADLWAVGATLYHAATGAGPFDRGSTGATLRAIVVDDIPVPDCQPDLAAAITALLNRDPAQRATIEQARTALRQVTADAPERPDDVTGDSSRDSSEDPTREAHQPESSPHEEKPREDKPRPKKPRPKKPPPKKPRADKRRPRRRVSRRAVIIIAILVAIGLYGAYQAAKPSGVLTLRTTVTAGDDAEGVALSPAGTMLATYGGLGQVVVWNADDGAKIATLPYESAFSAAFSPDGGTLAVADVNGNLHLWDADDRSLILNMGEVAATGVAFSPDGRTLAVADSNGVQLLDVATRKWTATMSGLGASAQPGTVAFSPDGSTLAAGDPFSGDVYVWNVRTDSLIATLKPPAADDSAGEAWIAFSPDSSTLAIIAAGQGKSADVRLWDVGSRTWIATLTNPSTYGADGSISFSRRGHTLAVPDIDGNVYFWNIATRKIIAAPSVPDGEAAEDVSFSADGRTLATSVSSPTVYVWNVAGTIPAT